MCGKEEKDSYHKCGVKEHAVTSVRKITGTALWIAGLVLLVVGLFAPLEKVYPKPHEKDNGKVSEEQARKWLDFEVLEALSRESLIRDDDGHLIDIAREGKCTT